MLIGKLKVDQLQARKNKDTLKADLLTYILGEIGRKRDKDESDAAVQALLESLYKKFTAALDENYTEKMHTELCIIDEYLPKRLTTAELTDKIVSISEEVGTNLGAIMKTLKACSTEESFVYDGKEASTIARSL